MTTEISIIGIFALLLIGCVLGFIVGWEIANKVWERTISDMLSPGWAKRLREKFRERGKKMAKIGLFMSTKNI